MPPDLKTALQPLAGRKTAPPPTKSAGAPSVGSPSPAAPAPSSADGSFGPAERIFHNAIRDGAMVEFRFLDGSHLIGEPVAIGRFAFAVRTDDGCEEAIFKHALRSLKRAGT
jgi:hypothetical protein